MKLLEKFTLGNQDLKNRMVMAPMTRCRATANGVVTDIMTKYYSQRVSAGLIITEATNISEQAIGSAYTPGIYTDEQIIKWKIIVQSVHENGGKIFLQLWHTGRVGHSSVRKGILPVAPSAIRIEDQQHATPSGMLEYEVPRALLTSEVKQIINDYSTAAENALEAGFDGVELHAGYGYLPNQFIVDGANQRTDEYGGSVANRCRFVLETMQELVDVCGTEKVGIKLSPSIPFNGMIDSNPTATFGYLISELNRFNLAYIHLMQPLFPLEAFPDWPKDVLKTFRPFYDGNIIVNGGYDRSKAEEAVQNQGAQLVAFGSLFLANPDLPRRFELDASLNMPNQETFYEGGEKGYIDYPVLN